MIKEVQSITNSIIAEWHVLGALTTDIPPTTDRVYNIGEDVLVYYENEKTWVGPCVFVDCAWRQILFRSYDGTKSQMYCTFHGKLYYQDCYKIYIIFNY